MYLKTLPKAGDPLEVVFSGREDGIAKVISIREYTGAYPEFFTHIVKYTAENTNSGWMEISVDVDEERNRKQKALTEANT